MKRLFMTLLLVIVVGATALFVFREPLIARVADRLTADMFVTQDQDTFDPGPAIGQSFPPIRARHAGTTVTGLDAFMGPRGLVFFANRSVDW